MGARPVNFRIAETFTDSLTRLTGDEQKAVKTTAFDLQINPANPGMRFHRLDRARDKSFWSVRVNRDLRLIVHRSAASLLLCYVDHHDAAYRWAERRRLEVHPTTGAAQLVEIVERVEEIAVPTYVEVVQPLPPKPALFAHVAEAALLSYGVPADWLDEVRRATEDTLFDLAEHLPLEAAEALLDLATGVIPQATRPVPPDTDPFEHPDALRRFRIVEGTEELQRALEYPWEKWTVFLHPAQREAVEHTHRGPARVAGSAGTGKTVVALHRAAFLARSHPESRVLLTTFSDPLAAALRLKLRRLLHHEPRLGERIEVHSLDAVALRLYERIFGRPETPAPQVIRELLRGAAAEIEGQRFSGHFLQAEWADVVDAWQLESWEAYRDVARLGRKTRLPQAQREALWSIFERVRSELREQGLVTLPGVYGRLTSHYAEGAVSPFDFIVVDEAQDVGVAQLRLLAALVGGRPNGLFFGGDLGQRIFQPPFSWKSLGVDVRGRSRTLRINYRTSHQIRTHADRLLGPEIADVDGNRERRMAISVFNGPEPVIARFGSPEEETEAVAKWLLERSEEGLPPHEIGIFVRSAGEIPRARDAVVTAGMAPLVLDERYATREGSVPIGTMHLAKGLEFPAVVVMACDDEVIPLQARIDEVSDESDLTEVYNTERHLLYVACTRARDRLLVTSGDHPSEFLDDLRGQPKADQWTAEHHC